ncbi:MAG TPA: tail fiber protein [Algoriphagus sp.]|nr:tail fiber protein [Algoriphagus sp.]
MDEYIGIVKMFAGNFAPKGWMFCQGQILPIAQYTAVFSLLGTTYGGNGTTTFALPDLRSRVPVGAGQGPGLSSYESGQVGGVENITLNITQIPMHTHAAQVKVSANAGTTNNPVNNFPAASQVQIERSGPSYPVNSYADSSTGSASSDSTTILPSGGNQPHSNIQPYLGMNYIICMEGIYPPRP